VITAILAIFMNAEQFERKGKRYAIASAVSLATTLAAIDAGKLVEQGGVAADTIVQLSERIAFPPIHSPRDAIVALTVIQACSVGASLLTGALSLTHYNGARNERIRARDRQRSFPKLPRRFIDRITEQNRQTREE
jgi:hypothetical protein